MLVVVIELHRITVRFAPPGHHGRRTEPAVAAVKFPNRLCKFVRSEVGPHARR